MSVAKKISQKFQKLDTKQKIYLVILVILFSLQFFLGDYYQSDLMTNFAYTSVLAIVGLIIAVIRRNKSRESLGGESTLDIIYNDYNLSSYASISILSLVYAIYQGILFGTGFGFILYAIGTIFVGGGIGILLNIGYSLLCLLLIIIVRISVETTSLIFRVAGDISKSSNKYTK